MRFFYILRIQNLFILIAVQTTVWWYVMSQYKENLKLSVFSFITLVLATVFIAAAGNIINDIYDVATDKINKPSKVWIPSYLDPKKAWILYFLLTFIGLTFGLITVYATGFQTSFLWFVVPAILLFFYAHSLKKVLIINNVLISFLVAYSILLVFIFELKAPFKAPSSTFTFDQMFWFLLVFSFGLNWMREITKDAEDFNGDQATGIQSIPIYFGFKKTKSLIQIIEFLLIGMLSAIALTQYKSQTFFAGYLILGVVFSLLLYNKQLHLAQTPKDYRKLSTLLKIIMLIGILSVYFVRY